MEAILLQHNTAMPGRHILEALADKFRYFTCCCSIPWPESDFVSLSSKMWLLFVICCLSESPERKGKVVVQFKQVLAFSFLILKFYQTESVGFAFKS